MARRRQCRLDDVFDIEQILSQAKYRWLRPGEICEILVNYKRFHVSGEPPSTPPPGGSLFLFDRKVIRYFRKDAVGKIPSLLKTETEKWMEQLLTKSGHERSSRARCGQRRSTAKGDAGGGWQRRKNRRQSCCDGARAWVVMRDQDGVASGLQRRGGEMRRAWN
ncbi:hypothetical protein M0R45_000706 [Rubus argutus]|uniref:CG-1 domain-containing protein n=1 Tax=Rubus argutus TaxID=59490 RepID=A0AAW1VNN9_RUBAR